MKHFKDKEIAHKQAMSQRNHKKESTAVLCDGDYYFTAPYNEALYNPNYQHDEIVAVYEYEEV